MSTVVLGVRDYVLLSIIVLTSLARIVSLIALLFRVVADKRREAGPPSIDPAQHFPLQRLHTRRHPEI